MKRRTFLTALAVAPVAVVAARVLPAEPSWMGLDLAAEESLSGLAILMDAAETRRDVMLSELAAEFSAAYQKLWYDVMVYGTGVLEMRTVGAPMYVCYSDASLVDDWKQLPDLA